eukprot:scaffold264194_cov31-Tisochrysis_lutea.AAC.2
MVNSEQMQRTILMRATSACTARLMHQVFVCNSQVFAMESCFEMAHQHLMNAVSKRDVSRERAHSGIFWRSASPPSHSD